jgi:hypothetical protein
MIKHIPSYINCLPWIWTKLTPEDRKYLIQNVNCGTVLEPRFWHLLTWKERGWYYSHQLLSPKFILNNWYRIEVLHRILICMYQPLSEKNVELLWDEMDNGMRHDWCSHVKVSKEFVLKHWTSMDVRTKMVCLLSQKLIDKFKKEELPIFLADDSVIIREAATNRMESNPVTGLFWKVISNFFDLLV